jgi:hypothetical protein
MRASQCLRVLSAVGAVGHGTWTQGQYGTELMMDASCNCRWEGVERSLVVDVGSSASDG